MSKYYKLLTYNVNWKNMKYNKECVENINKIFVEYENKIDFLLIQEVANERNLFKNLNLKEFVIIKHKSGKETMISLISNKYKVIKYFTGQFIYGRPFQVILLENNLCIINVHFPHVDNIYTELLKISKYLDKLKVNLEDYRIIIAGDFNLDINKKIKFMNKTFGISDNKYSCCIRKYVKDIKLLFVNFDHVLDSNNKIYKTKLVYPHKNNIVLPGSDHIGLYSKILI